MHASTRSRSSFYDVLYVVFFLRSTSAVGQRLPPPCPVSLDLVRLQQHPHGEQQCLPAPSCHHFLRVRDARIIFKHILPNASGVVIVSATLLAAAAILLETALSYLQLGVRPPDVSLGLIISDNQSAFQTRPWLFWWPAVFIVSLALLVNFVGDGLRDAFDPRQKRFKLRKIKNQEAS